MLRREPQSTRCRRINVLNARSAQVGQISLLVFKKYWLGDSSLKSSLLLCGFWWSIFYLLLFLEKNSPKIVVNDVFVIVLNEEKEKCG